MNAKIYLDQTRAEALYRFLIGLLVLGTFCYQQVAHAQAPQVTVLAASTEAAAPAPGNTMAPYAAKEAAWWSALEEQFAASLESPVEGIRQATLQNVIFFATNYSSQASLKKAVPPLLDIYRYERDEAHRLMALAALHAIGEEGSMETLAKRVRFEKPGRVRHCTLAALADHLERRR